MKAIKNLKHYDGFIKHKLNFTFPIPVFGHIDVDEPSALDFCNARSDLVNAILYELNY